MFSTAVCCNSAFILVQTKVDDRSCSHWAKLAVDISLYRSRVQSGPASVCDWEHRWV